MANFPWYILKMFSKSTEKSKEEAKEVAPVVEAAPKNTKSMIVKRPGAAFGAGSTFEEPSVDLLEVERAYNSESYVRQAVDKYVDLTFKEGWTLKGKNVNANEYISTRFKMISIATNTPFETTLIQMMEDLVKYSNVFIIKARAATGKGPTLPGVKVTGIEGKQPIAGYFLVNPTTITILRDTSGAIKKYKQTVSGSNPIEWKPEDVIHVTYKKDRGYAFGQPIVTPVIDDIKALRDAEENVLRLIYQYLFPFYVYTIGLPEPGFQATDAEIEAAKETIQNMAVDGGLVVPERHKIDIQTATNTIDASVYLEYFEKRVFTGLGVSEVQMGRGGAANRSTSDTLSTEMHDRAKAFQKLIARSINFEIINELLMEGGFDSLSNPQDAVEFVFNEIELESVIKKDNDAIYKYEHNSITEDEMRMMLGRDPITDRSKMFSVLVTQANSAADAAAKAQNTADVDNKQTPTNKATPKTTTKPTPAPTKKAASTDAILTESQTSKLALESKLRIPSYRNELQLQWSMTESDVKDMVNDVIAKSSINDRQVPKMLGVIINLTNEDMKKKAEKFILAAFENGITDARMDTSWSMMPANTFGLEKRRLKTQNEETIDKLTKRLLEMLDKAFKTVSNEDLMSTVIGIFASMEYKMKFISNSEMAKAYNYGYCSAAAVLGRTEAKVILSDEEDSCDVCKEKGGATIDLTVDFFDKVPPFHSNCMCTVRMKDN
jgi:hypothetical protein